MLEFTLRTKESMRVLWGRVCSAPLSVEAFERSFGVDNVARLDLVEAWTSFGEACLVFEDDGELFEINLIETTGSAPVGEGPVERVVYRRMEAAK